MVVLAAGVPLLVDAGKKNLNAVIDWGRQHMMQGDFEAAIQQFDIALDLKPGLAHALVSRGFCHLSLGDPVTAQRDFQEVINRDAVFSRKAYVLVAICFTRVGEYQTAIRYLSRCLQQFPAFQPALLARAELYLKHRSFDHAIADFRAVLAEDPLHLVARRGLGDGFRGLANIKEALRHYTSAIEDVVQILAERGEQQQQQQEKSGSGGHDDGSSSTTDDSGDIIGCSTSEPTFSSVRDEQDLVVQSGDGPVPGQESQMARADPDGFLTVTTSPLHDTAQLRIFLMELFMRRALLLRLAGQLEEAGVDLLEVLQMDPQNGLALFWYAKVLLEQQRQKESQPFLQASLQHHEGTRAHAHALLGALAMIDPQPDCEYAMKHLKEAVRLQPQNQAARVTLFICNAMSTLMSSDDLERKVAAQRALGFLERALTLLHQHSLHQQQQQQQGGSSRTGGTSSGRAGSEDSQACASSAMGAGGSLIVMKGGKGLTPRVHVAGSGTSAAAALSARGRGDNVSWSTARAVVQRKQELAQGDDLELALSSATSYLQLVAKEPRLQVAALPPMLFDLQALALCELCLWEDAVSASRVALALDPSDEVTLYNMHLAAGVLRSEANDPEGAVGSFTKAIRLRPTSSHTRVHRALSLAMAARRQTNREAEKATQLLHDALADLDAASQQAEIAGTMPPPGILRLQVACLCSLGNFAEAAQVLSARTVRGSSSSSTSRSPRGQGVAEPSSRDAPWGVVHAEVLLLQHRYTAACDIASDVIIGSSAADNLEALVQAYLVRGRCWAELGESEQAFQDFREAMVLMPHSETLHEASGELFLLQGCFSEAVTAFNTVAKLTGNVSARLAYLRALAYFGMHNLSAAMKDMHRAVHLNPHLSSAHRARDGFGAFQMLMEKDFTHARVRFNTLLHARSPGLSTEFPVQGDSFPLLFFPHELVMYRGICALYVHDAAAAAQDFEAALELVRQMVMAVTQSCQEETRKRLPPEVVSEQGCDSFECEVLYNLILCQLVACDHGSALAMCEKLLQSTEALKTFGQHAHCLLWFLLGLCRMAVGDATTGEMQDAFTRSYSYDPCYVDDFLRRHDPSLGRVAASAAPPPAPPGRVGAPGGRPAVAVPFRPIGGPVGPPNRVRINRDACNSSPDAICCLRQDRGRLGARLQPLRIEIKDVVIWARPSAAWPAIRAPGPSPTSNLSRLDLCSHEEVGMNLATPWIS